MGEPAFEYDVAFSFHSLDEGLASEINDLLQPQFETFLYSKKQEVLAGTDGEETFNAIFGRKARCVVVLCRKEWGETPFTRIEQTAIRNRAFEHGFDFSLFVPTDKPPCVPPWLPRPRLWFGLERFGLKGLAAVIEARVQELGGEPRVESVLDRATRLQRNIELSEAKRLFRDSDVGVAEATKAFAALIQALEERVTRIASGNGRLAGLRFRKISEYWTISGLGPWLTLYWSQKFINTLDGCALQASVYDGVPRLPGIIPAGEDGRRLRSLNFEYHLVGLGHHAFLEKGDERPFSGDDLADHLLRIYFDATEQHRRL